jgi:Spy/CpxP family protein refolding chaperone
MIKSNTYRTLIWIIVILLATNLSMGISFMYHRWQDKKLAEKVEEINIEMPAEQRTKFFREQLNLQPDQVDKFREWNREFNRTGSSISYQLENLRIEMINELGKETPDQSKLENISNDIGKHHSELKKVTIDYYLKMKAECNEEQRKKLNEIFMSMLKKNEDVKLPGRYGRNRRDLDNSN